MSTSRVDFTRAAAERIARTVRTVERGERDQAPLTFGPPNENPADKIRIITFTGNWLKTQTKTVTIDPGTVTMSAINLFANISFGSCSRKGAVAKSDNTWYLIAAEGP